jgi:hypothetical protein
MANPLAQTILSAVDKTQAAFNSVNKNLKAMEDRAQGINSIFARFLPLLGAASIVSFGKNIIDAADNMNDLAQRTGISIDRIAAWDLATKQSGTSIEALTTALGKGSKFLVEHADDLKKLGINAKTSEELIFQLSDVISNMPADDPRRTAIAMQVLGKSAGELIPLLAQGSEELRKMVAQGAELAKVYKELGPEADEFNDNLELAKLRTEVLAARALTPFIKRLNDTQEALVNSDSALESFWIRTKQFMADFSLLPNLISLFSSNSEAAAKNTEKTADSVEGLNKQLGILKLSLKSQGEEIAKTQKTQVVDAFKQNIEALKQQISGFKDLGKAMQTAFVDAGAAAKQALLNADQFLQRARNTRLTAQDRISDIDLRNAPADQQDAVRNQQILDALDKAKSARLQANFQRLQGNTEEATRLLDVSEQQAQRADDITGKLNDEELMRQRILETSEAQAQVDESRAQIQQKIAEEESARQESLRQQMIANDQTISDLTTRLDQLNAKVKELSNAEADVKITTDREAYDKTLTDIQALEARLAALSKGVNVPVTVAQNSAPITQDAFESAGNFANGGVIPGRSPHPRADDKLVWATSGEGMVNVAAMRHYGGASWLDAINKRLIPRFADGGVIGRVSVQSLPESGSPLSGIDRGTFVLPGGERVEVMAQASVFDTLERASLRVRRRRS